MLVSKVTWCSCTMYPMIHRGAYTQRGSGLGRLKKLMLPYIINVFTQLGSILARVFGRLVPFFKSAGGKVLKAATTPAAKKLAKKALKSAGKSAAKAAGNAV